MADSVYKVIELVGTSEKGWEDAAKNAVKTRINAMNSSSAPWIIIRIETMST